MNITQYLLTIILIAFIANLIASYLTYREYKKLNIKTHHVGNQRINPETGKAEILIKKEFNGKKLTYEWKDLIVYYCDNYAIPIPKHIKKGNYTVQELTKKGRRNN